MTVVGLVIQNHQGNVLFQNVRDYLSDEKANLASKAFINQITSYDDSFISRGSVSHLTGSIVVLNMYRVYYMILNELFILAISHANDNPYEGTLYLARAKRVLMTVSKELTEAQIQKKYTEVYFALERVLFGEDGVEVLTQRMSDVQPHFISSSQEIGVSDSSSSGDGLNNSGSSHFPNVPLVSSFIPGSSANTSNNSVSVGGRLLECGIGNVYGTLPPTLSRQGAPGTEQYLFDSLHKLDGLVIPEGVFTQPQGLPKVDKNIYDPPAQVKWGSTTAPAYTGSNRVNNRIMFTLRHPTNSITPISRSPNGSPIAQDDELMSLSPSPLSLSDGSQGGSSPDAGQSAQDTDAPAPGPEQLPETTGRKYSISDVTFKKPIPESPLQSSASPLQSSASPNEKSPVSPPTKPDTTTNQPQQRDHTSSVSIPIKSKFLI